MKFPINRQSLDPTVTPPRKAFGLAGALAAGLVAAGTLTQRQGARALLHGAAAFVAVAYPGRVVYEAQQAAVQESRELWGLSGVMVEGRPWPPPGGWALGADALNFLIREVRRRELRTVVELGPGTSSIVLGRAGLDLDMYGVEHDDVFVGIVRENLTAHGLADYKLIHAPLAGTRIGNREVEWYDEDALDGLPDTIDVLIVDGPPNWLGGGNRSPALEVLGPRVRPGGVVIVDDTQRDDEREMALAWARSGRASVLFDAGSFIALEVLG